MTVWTPVALSHRRPTLTIYSSVSARFVSTRLAIRGKYLAATSQSIELGSHVCSRQRKVKCDSNVPCKTCIERNHADICNFNPPPKRQDTGTSHAGASDTTGSVTLEKDEWDRLCSKISAMERSFTELKDDLRRVVRARRGSNGDGSPGPVKEESAEPDGPRYVRAMEINEQSHLTGERVHLGGGSVPALVMALQASKENQPAVREVFGSSVLPLFGLDNESATYPFVDLWGYPKSNVERMHELCKALPNDSACLEYVILVLLLITVSNILDRSFTLYRDFAHVTYPAIVDINKFETDLLTFLNARRSSPGSGEYNTMTDTVYGMSIQWLGLLFAAFASGTQFSTRPKKERDPVSQVYGRCFGTIWYHIKLTLRQHAALSNACVWSIISPTHHQRLSRRCYCWEMC